MDFIQGQTEKWIITKWNGNSVFKNRSNVEKEEVKQLIKSFHHAAWKFLQSLKLNKTRILHKLRFQYKRNKYMTLVATSLIFWIHIIKEIEVNCVLTCK